MISKYLCPYITARFLSSLFIIRVPFSLLLGYYLVDPKPPFEEPFKKGATKKPRHPWEFPTTGGP